MPTFPLPTRADPHDVLTPEIAFVYARRGDPHVTAFIADRDVPAGGSSHLVHVDAFHNGHDLIARMEERKSIHLL